MKTKSEIMVAIKATIDKSEALTRAAERRHAAAVTAAFSGAGFSSETATKMANWSKDISGDRPGTRPVPQCARECGGFRIRSRRRELVTSSAAA